MKALCALAIVVCLVHYARSSACNLPGQWSGKWFLSKDMELLSINATNFINRGTCVEQKQDKFLFYESKEECYRCVFIMQKHPNVIQYRASYCTDQSDFYSNCQNLSPESELVTIYRDTAPTEKCPLGGLYMIQHGQPTALAQHSGLGLNEDELVFKSSKCNNQESSIMQCSDPSMLKLQFGKCSSTPPFIVHCMAHWTEGNTNYLIGRVSASGAQKPSYRCLVYQETMPASSTHSRRSNDPNLFINTGGGQNSAKSTIQLSVSQDEFCRTLESSMDEQLSFTFTQVEEPRYIISPSTDELAKRRKVRRDANSSMVETVVTKKLPASRKGGKLKSVRNPKRNHHYPCRFPKWLNKKWHNLKQTKLFALDPRLDSLLVFDDKGSVINNKYTCHQVKSRKPHNTQIVVRSLNGCSTGYQCLTISSKSEYVLEVKLGKVSHKSSNVDCNDNFISQEFVYVETSYGVSCPLRNGIYEKLYSNSVKTRQLVEKTDHQPCKHLTQTQTLQIGSLNEQQYSLKTKLCYPNHQYRPEAAEERTQTSTSTPVAAGSTPAQTVPTTAAYTQLESEINLVCLGHWQHEGNHVIVSRTMSNEILCSIWASSDNGKFLQLLEIDSNCNYNAKKMSTVNSKINYGFVLVSDCTPSSSNDKPFESSVSASLSNQQTPDSSSLAIGVDTREADRRKPPSLVAVPSSAAVVVRSPSHPFVLLAFTRLILLILSHISQG